MLKHTHSLWQPKSRLLAGLALVCAVALIGSWSAMTATVPAAKAANAAGSALLSDARLDAGSGSFSQNGGGAG
ncbi:MAG: hypothetical protein ABI977_34520 [Acidobacteriota bacterium]